MYIICICVHTHTHTQAHTQGPQSSNSLSSKNLTRITYLEICFVCRMRWRNGNEQLFKMATTKHTTPPPQRTHAQTQTHTHRNRLIRNVPRNLVIYNITALIIKIQPGSAAPSQCPVQWGLMECLISWQMHAFRQKCKVILTFTPKKKEKITLRPGKRTQIHLLTSKSGKREIHCLLIATHSWNTNPALQLCVTLNGQVCTELWLCRYLAIQKYGFLWIEICVSNWTNPSVCITIIRMIVFIEKITSLVVLTGDRTHQNQTHNGFMVGADQFDAQKRGSCIWSIKLVQAGFCSCCNGTVCQFEPFYHAKSSL